jgi:hypothetical protein
MHDVTPDKTSFAMKVFFLAQVRLCPVMAQYSFAKDKLNGKAKGSRQNCLSKPVALPLAAGPGLHDPLVG